MWIFRKVRWQGVATPLSSGTLGAGFWYDRHLEIEAWFLTRWKSVYYCSSTMFLHKKESYYHSVLDFTWLTVVFTWSRKFLQDSRLKDPHKIFKANSRKNKYSLHSNKENARVWKQTSKFFGGGGHMFPVTNNFSPAGSSELCSLNHTVVSVLRHVRFFWLSCSYFLSSLMSTRMKVWQHALFRRICPFQLKKLTPSHVK